jgi:hypothetical protein
LNESVWEIQRVGGETGDVIVDLVGMALDYGFRGESK